MIDYKLYLIRHGITQGNLEGRYIGATDLPLCREGERQLFKLKRSRIYPDVQAVYSSPLTRCLETAEILFPESRLHLVENLREYDFGVFDGKSVAEISGTEAFRRWSDSGMRETPEGGERMEDFLLRCEEGLREVVGDMMKKRITEAALILHGGVMMNLLANHAYPKREPVYWKAEPGEGYTALITPQLWHRGEVLEIFDPIPYAKNDRREPEPFGRYDLSDEEDDG